MTKITASEVVGRIVEMLTPLQSEDRRCIIQASLALLGEAPSDTGRDALDVTQHGEGTEGALNARARAWTRQNNISESNLQEVFHIGKDGVDLIASEVPGKSKKEKTLNAYILTGVANLLATGEPSFDDKAARELCERSACYDSTNHSKFLKEKGNEFTGSKEKGWSLTTPGLRRGAELVRASSK